MLLKGLELDRSFPWIPVGALVAILLVGLIGLIEVRPVPDPLRIAMPETQEGVVLSDFRSAQGGETILGELVLKDPTPLFLPTRWNSGQVEARLPAERAPGASFTEINAKPVFSEAVNELQLPDGVEVPATPISALEEVEGAGSRVELSTRDEGLPVLPIRTGYFEVTTIDTGKVIYDSILTSSVGGLALQVPVEAILVVNTVGVWVRPTVIEALEGTAVDFDQINLWVQGQRLDTILEAGIYRILLGP